MHQVPTPFYTQKRVIRKSDYHVVVSEEKGNQEI